MINKYKGMRIYIWIFVVYALFLSKSQVVLAVQIAGTPPRVEIEAKLAFSISKEFDDLEFTRGLHSLIKKNLNLFRFGNIGRCDLKLDKIPKTFAFLDYYYDTKDRKILKKQSSYRLRFRWSDYLSYVRKSIYPFTRRFPFTRVELQAKTNYRFLDNGNLEVKETRFEFREEASPFSDGVDLPPKSWQELDYEKLIFSEVYGAYRHYPGHLVRQNIIDGEDQLQRSLVLLTKRHRMHLRCKNPFGWGQNPEQIMIVSIDKTYCKEGCFQNNRMVLEVEIERERNISTILDRVAGYQSTEKFSNSIIAEEAITYAKKVKSVFDRDHLLLVNLVKSNLKALNIHSLQSDFKYSRFASRN